MFSGRNKKNINTWSSELVVLHKYDIQSTFVISKSKGLSEILQDIRISTYQICRIEEKINQTTTFSKQEQVFPH